MNERRDPVPLSGFCDALERRLAQRFPGTWPSFQVEVCGKRIELQFASKEDAAYASGGFLGRIVQDRQTPHAVFRYWKDRCVEYVGAENVSARWEKRDGSGYIANYIRRGFLCADHRKKVFYCCDDSDGGDSMLYMHAMHMVFYQWASGEGLMMFHAAAIGAGGRGALVAGRSGAGKSTLSAACMLAGMDVVGDDYVILTGDGAYRAMPLYSSVCLNPDIYGLLRPAMRVLEIAPSGKYALDASGYLYPGELEIGCLLAIEQGSGAPQITAVPSGPAITRLVHSTVIQAGFGRDTERVREMAVRLSGLPAYQFRQGEDPRRNAQFLRQFIEKEL